MRTIRILAVSLLLAGCPAFAAQSDVTTSAPSAGPAASPSVGTETGLAAVYSDRLDGHKTASGKIYHGNQLTAAHKTLPFGTRVRLTNSKNGRSVEVTITDRGPRQANRILDISPRAARALGIPRKAMREVRLEVIAPQ